MRSLLLQGVSCCRSLLLQGVSRRKESLVARSLLRGGGVSCKESFSCKESLERSFSLRGFSCEEYLLARSLLSRGVSCEEEELLEIVKGLQIDTADNAVFVLLIKVVHKRMRQVFASPSRRQYRFGYFPVGTFVCLSRGTYSISTLTMWAMSP